MAFTRLLRRWCRRLADRASSAAAEPELLGQDGVGVLAQPGDPRLGTLGHVGELHRVAGDEHRLVDAVGARHLDEHVAGGDVRVGDHLVVAEARPGGDARPRTSPRTPRAASCPTPTPRRPGRMTSSRWSTQPCRSAKRGSVVQPGWPTSSASAANCGSRPTWMMNQPSDARNPSMISGADRAVAQAERPEVGDDVGHGDHGVEHRDVDVLALPGGVAVAERRQHADHARRAPTRCRRARRPARRAAGRRRGA